MNLAVQIQYLRFCLAVLEGNYKHSSSKTSTHKVVLREAETITFLSAPF